MKATALAAVLIVAAPVAFAARNQCSLSPSALAAYDHGSAATEEQWRDTRRAISEFMTCDMAEADPASRPVFFDAVAREFRTDHSAELAAWQKKRPGSEALWEGIGIFQHDLKTYIDQTVTLADMRYRDTILRYGNGKAIAALGPAVRADVLKLLGVPNRPYGLGGRYNQQFAALDAIGYWIDADDVVFSPVEKSELTSTLTGALTGVADVASQQPRELLDHVFRALARSNDALAEAGVRAWIERHPNAGPLLRTAEATAAAIHRRRL